MAKARESEYQKLCAEIKRMVALGDVGEDGKIPSERRLGELFKVSRVTVRLALEEAERQGLVERRHGSGTYAKNQGGAGLDKNALTFVFEVSGKPLLENPYVSMSIDGISRAATRLGFGVDLLPLAYGEGALSYLRKNPHLIPTAKAIIIKWSPLQLESARWFQQRGHIVVAMGPAKDEPDLPYVDIDNVLGGKIAAERLLANGCRRLAYADGPLSDVSVNETLSGIRSACRSSGCPFDPGLLRETVPWEEESGRQAMIGLLEAGIPFDGVVFRGDMASLGAMKVLKERGIEVPRQVAFITYDDFPWLQKICVPLLTAVRQPYDLMAETAAERAIEAARNGLRRIASQMLAPTLSIRESCGTRVLVQT